MYYGQVDGSVEVYGIEIFSRHGLIHEFRELMDFCEAASALDVARYIKGAWYDSNGATAVIEFHIPPGEYDPVFDATLEAAEMTLSAFCIKPSGYFAHGRRPNKRPSSVATQKPASDGRPRARVTTVHHWRADRPKR
ncbi:MAG: hypothetical protein EOL86_09460 [Deltaproteobacteria bacterium]|nr:hypothetical protein [Deltaproteobacteria bacterium]